MRIHVIGTSSRGNCIALDAGSPMLLLDAGIPIARVKESLDHRLCSTVGGALITHSHKDHAGHVGALLRMGVDCWMLPDTAESIGAKGHRVKTIKTLEPFRIGGWTVYAFPLVHDVPSVGYFIGNGDGSKALYITDTAYTHYRFNGITHLLIECNWSEKTLAPDLDPAIKNRLVRSHFSLENVKKFIAANDMSHVREIHLLHLSRGNSDAEMFRKEIAGITGKPVYVGRE